MPGENTGELPAVPPIEPRQKSEGIRRVPKRLIPLVLAGAYVTGGDMPVQQVNLPPPITIPGAKPEPSQGIRITPPPVESPKPSGKEEVLNPKKIIEQKYGINIIDADSKNLDEDLKNLNRILSAMPEDFFSPIDGSQINIVIVGDSDDVQPRPGNTIVIPESHLTQVEDNFGVENNSAYLDLIGPLVRWKDEVGGFAASGEIMKILGDFQKHPFFEGIAESDWNQKVRELFVDDKDRALSPSEIVGNLGRIFIRGVPEFGLIEQAIDPENTPPSETKTEKIYQVLRKHFFGGDVVRNVNGIPQISEYNGPLTTPGGQPVFTS